MIAVLVLVGLLLGEVCSAETPRVALMFATRGPMPLEDVWKQFLSSVQGVRPPALSEEQWKEVMQEDKVKEVERRIRKVGQFTPNTIVQNKTCVVNSDITVRYRLTRTPVLHPPCSILFCTLPEPEPQRHYCNGRASIP